MEYMAPEVIDHKSYSNGIDVWSLGVLLYEMLHGYPPFKVAGDSKSPKEQIVFEEHVKDDVKEIVSAMLAVDPKERPAVRELFGFPWMQRMSKEIAKPKLPPQ